MAKKTLRHGRTKKGKAKSTEAVPTGGSKECLHPAYGALKGYITFVPGVDLTEPADPEWGERVWEDDQK